MTRPAIAVPKVADAAAADPLSISLAKATILPDFRLMDDSAAARLRTRTALGWDPGALHVEFRCADDDAWATMTERDQPLWQEEVVELFLAAGQAWPERYFELEVNPLGALFDARVFNPRGDRSALEVDTSWSCAGLCLRVEASGERSGWRVRLAIPWRSLELEAPPRSLSANFYRVERPRNGPEELSGWSPTLTAPPDFHRPMQFGVLHLREFV